MRDAAVGEPVAQFGPNFNRIVPLAFICGLPLLTAVYAVAGAPVGNTAEQLQIAAAISAMSLPLVWLLCIRPLRMRAVLCRDGFVLINGRRRNAVSFGNITRVYRHVVQKRLNGIPVARDFYYRIVVDDGREEKTIKLVSWIHRVDQLGEAIQKSVFSRLLAEAVTRLQAGQSAAFDKLQIRTTGLFNGRHTLPWERTKIQFAHGFLFIRDTARRRGCWESINLKHVPNLPVFLAICEHFSDAAP